MLASLYSHVRAAAASRSHRLARPVISIGNISMGGRGKTPLAGLVARLLVEAGERPSILSRGYGRAIVSDGVTVVSDGHDVIADLAHAGDEPMMLARAVPGAAVLVAEQRALAGTLAERAFDCTVHVLDDGFQHHQLARDIDIVIVRAEDLKSQPLPFGRLREPVEMLEHADALVFDGGAEAQRSSFVGRSSLAGRSALVGRSFSSGPYAGAKAQAYMKAPAHPQAPAYTQAASFTLLRSLPAPAQPAAKVFAVAGIAQPERFFDALSAAGYTVVGVRGFKDHHRYSAADVAAIERAAAEAGAAAIVTTSKDMVRLEGRQQGAGAQLPFTEIRLDVTVEPAPAFRDWLLGRLAEVRQ